MSSARTTGALAMLPQRGLREEIDARLEQLEIPFGAFGIDPYGVSKSHLRWFYYALGVFYRDYFRVRAYDVGHIPKRGRAMLIGNHSGGVALDGAMVVASTFFEPDPPRLAQGMIEKFLTRLPIASELSSRLGQFTGLPEHAIRLLEDDRLVMVFPEGARGTAKLYWERTSLVHFGTGFMRLALETKTPIVPFAFVGGGDAIPTIFNAYGLGKLMGAPYIPFTPWIFPVPRPARLDVVFDAPMIFEGTGSEEDDVIEGYVAQVKAKIATLIDRGRRLRGETP